MDTQTLALDGLAAYHRNARRGNVDAIADSLKVNGQYKPIVVNKGTHTGRPFEVLVGNHTVEAARQIGLEELAAVLVDVDDDKARRIVLADNRTSDLATYDDAALAGLLAEADLEGTGFTEADLDGLLASPEVAERPEEFPEYGEDTPTQHACPSCGYEWSGSTAKAPADGE